MKKILILTLSLLTINLVSKAQVELTSTSVGATYYVTVPSTFVLTPGLQVTFKANVDNSASMSLDVSGTGAKPIRKLGGSQPLSGSDILSNQIVTVAYDGSNWQMISAIGSTPTAPTNYWSPNGSDIFNNNAGNVGIGTTPSTKLDVANSTLPTSSRFSNTFSSAGSKMAVYGWATGGLTGDNMAGAFDAYNSTGTNFAVYGSASGNSGNKTALYGNATGTGGTNTAGYFSASGGTNNYAIIIPSTGGNVGIGTTSPLSASKLHVVGAGNGSTLNVEDNTLSNGSLLYLSSTSIVGTGGTNSRAITINRSGANTNATHTAYGIQSNITNTGATSTNVAGYFSASGATDNFAIIVPSTGGNVGIGTTAPAQKLEIQDGHILLSNTGTQSELRFKEASANGGNIISFKAPAALAANVQYTLPINVGAANDVLSNDGTGTLSWTSVSSLANAWGLGGNAVGSIQTIGTTTNFDLPFITFNTERMRLNAAGTQLNSTVDNALSLGSVANSWKDIYADGYLYINGERWTSLSATNTLIGTRGNQSFTSGNYNVGVGYGSGNAITTGFRNTFVGHRAGELLTTSSDNTLIGNLTGGLTNALGDNNTLIGSYAGYGVTNSGTSNTYVGAYSGGNNTTGNSNAFLGYNSGLNNTTGYFNTFIGAGSGQVNLVGNLNTFTGYLSGNNNTGDNNTFNGYASGRGNTTGGYNAFFGTAAGWTNTTGFGNSYYGGTVGYNNNGSYNTFMGYGTAYNATSGDYNTLIGTNAGGAVALLGTFNTYLGYGANGSASLTNATAIGKNANVTTSNSIVLGGSGADAVNVGIGTTAPTEKLDVNGSFKLVNGSQANNRVLASNATGVATWTDLTTLSSGSTAWTRVTPNIYPTTLTDNVGIGTSTPGTYKLNVNGNLGVSGDGTIESVGTTGGAAPRISYGFNSSASGGYGAMGVGYTAVASGTVAIALGQSVTASGYSAVAIGQSNTASGGNATAIGYGNTAAGTSSSAFGSSMSTSAAAANSFGIGLSATTYTIANPNTMAIMGGKVGIGTVSASESLEVSGNVEITSIANGYMIANDTILRSDGNTSMYIGQTGGTGGYGVYAGFRAGNVSSGVSNTFVGAESGEVNTSGTQNAFFGLRSGRGNTTGSYNTFIGRDAGVSNTTGSYNTTLGYNANVSSGALTYSSAIGYNASIGQSYGMALGGTGAEAIEVGIGVNNNMAGKLHAYSSTPTYNIAGTDYNSAIYGEVVGAVYSSRGIMGVSWATGTYGIGAYGSAQGAATNNYGVYGYASGGTNNYAGYFDAGNVFINNRLGINDPAPTYELDVSSLTTTYAGRFRNTGTGGADGLRVEVITAASATGTRYGTYSLVQNGLGIQYGILGIAQTGGTTNYGVYGAASGGSTNNYAIYCAGSGGYTGTWSLISDQRFKENIKPLTGALDKILSLEPKTYNLKAKEYSYLNFPTGTQIGLISQEVEKIIPELVEKASHPGPIDEKTGEPTGNPIEFKSMNYIGLTPVLVQAIKEQQAIIEDLKKQLEAQKLRIDAIENK